MDAGSGEVALETGDHSAEERALLSEHIVAYRLDGPLVDAPPRVGAPAISSA